MNIKDIIIERGALPRAIVTATVGTTQVQVPIPPEIQSRLDAEVEPLIFDALQKARLATAFPNPLAA